jgi:hypothetical protein
MDSMEQTYSIWIPWNKHIPYGFHGTNIFHMDSIWNPYGMWGHSKVLRLRQSAYNLLWWHRIIAWQDQGRKNGTMDVIFVVGLRQIKQESEVRYNFYTYDILDI